MQATSFVHFIQKITTVKQATGDSAWKSRGGMAIRAKGSLTALDLMEQSSSFPTTQFE